MTEWKMGDPLDHRESLNVGSCYLLRLEDGELIIGRLEVSSYLRDTGYSVDDSKQFVDPRKVFIIDTINVISYLEIPEPPEPDDY